MKKVVIILIVLLFTSSCSGEKVIQPNIEMETDSTSVDLLEETSVVIDGNISEQDSSGNEEEVELANKDTDVVNQQNENLDSIDEVMDFYFEYGTDGLFSEKITNDFYLLYKNIEFKNFVKACSKYSISIQNRISSYLIHGIYINEDDFKLLEENIGNLGSEKAYSYFTERLLIDIANSNLQELQLEDDFIDNSDFIMIESSIESAETVGDLVELSFIYTIDGAYAESYSAQIKNIYDSMDFGEFVAESIKYGEVIQEDIACYLAYGINYFENDKRDLEEQIKKVIRDDSNSYFLESLEKCLNMR